MISKKLSQDFSVLILVLSILLFVPGCAMKNGEDPMANTVALTQGLTQMTAREGLLLLDEYVPDQVDPTIEHIDTLIMVITQFESGEANATNVSNSLVILLNHLNASFKVIDDKNVSRLLRSITDVALIADRYFEPTAVPQEALDIAGAVKAGLISGKEQFEIFRSSPPEDPAPLVSYNWSVMP